MPRRKCITYTSLATSTIVVMLLAGCDLTSPYEQPATPPLPAQWSESTSEAETSTEAASLWPELDWWKNFQSDELTAFIEEAKTNNNDLGASVARIRQADAQTTISGAPLLPAIDATAGGERAIAPKKSNPPKRATGNSFSAGITASYEIDFWGKNRSALDSAEALRDASVYDHQTVLLTVTSSVADVYFDWLATTERLRIARENLDASEKLLDALQRRYDQGLVSKLDLAQQQNLVATQRAAVPPLQLQATRDRDALAILLGRLPESMPEPEDNFDAIALPNVPEGVPSELLTRRPDIQFAEANLIGAHADINAARAAFFPSIGLTAGANTASTALGNLFQPGGLLLTLGTSIAQPIFEGGRLSGQLEYTHAREDELTQNYHKAIISAFADVEDALSNVHNASEQEQAQAEAEQSARLAFVLSQRQFSGGVVDITSVLNTQRSLFSASDAHLQSKLNRLQALVGLYKALGGGWQKPAE